MSIVTGSVLSMDEGAVVIVMVSILNQVSRGGHCDWFRLVHR